MKDLKKDNFQVDLQEDVDMFVKLLSDKKENKYQYDSVVIINDYYQEYVRTNLNYE